MSDMHIYIYTYTYIYIYICIMWNLCMPRVFVCKAHTYTRCQHTHTHTHIHTHTHTGCTTLCGFCVYFGNCRRRPMSPLFPGVFLDIFFLSRYFFFLSETVAGGLCRPCFPLFFLDISFFRYFFLEINLFESNLCDALTLRYM